jgi:hypothetical protein
VNKDKGSVTFYTRAMLPVSFPESDVCCQWCPLLGIETRLDRHYCKRTGEFIPNPKLLIGGQCPLVFETEELDG